MFAYFGIIGLLVFGALNTLTTKIQFTMGSVGSAGNEKFFQKPFFAAFTMFVAMACVLFWHYGSVALERRRERQLAGMTDGGDPLLAKGKRADESKEQLSELWNFLYVGIPATLDLLATCLMFYGLLWMTASMYQMLRGAMIIFSAIVSVPLLGKKLYGFHWMGVMACVVGITCVGASNVLNQSSDGGDTGSTITHFESAMGIVFVLAAQVVQATQVVCEEKFLTEVNIPPFKIVGFEGLWGSLEFIFVVFPLCWFLPGGEAENGHLEDTLDTFVMLSNSGALQALVLVYIFSCSTYNAAGMAVTSSFSAVHRTMLEASRTGVIWGFDLIIHYIVNPKVSFGEAWLPYSWLQLTGFIVVVAGQMIYGEVIKLPGFYYPAWAPPRPLHSPAAMMSPAGLPNNAL
jgi:drug/metabolite transporter (DMT)-like permease